MKSEQSKTSFAKRGVSRLWLGVAAVVGAAGAYLADPERGGARREAAMRQLSGAAKSAAERTGRWRDAVSARLSRSAKVRLPEQVTVPTDAGSAASAKPMDAAGPVTAKRPATSVPKPEEASAEPKKTDA